MRKPLLGIITLTIVVVYALTGISCNREKAASKISPLQAEVQKKTAEALTKSFEESKKVIAAKVNGADITTYELVREMNEIAPQYVNAGKKTDVKTDAKVRKVALDRLIFRELAVQEAIRQGMKVPPEAVGSALKKIKSDLKSEEAYREKLKQSGMTEEELKKLLEKNLLIDMITEKEIFDKVKIDPAQVQKTYAKDKASYKGPSGQMSFEEARPLIEQKLMTPLVQKREDEWVKGLTKAAKIEITLGQSEKEIHGLR